MPQNQVASGTCDRHVNPTDGVGSLTNGPRTHPAHAEGRLEYKGAEPGRPKWKSKSTMPSPSTPIAIAENHESRSRYVQDLVQNPPPPLTHPERAHASIPRALVQFWHDLANIPHDVRACLDTWRPLHRQGFSGAMFDDAQARHFISVHFPRRHLRAFDRCYHPAMRCDYFRLCYLLVNGGFYIDADEEYQGADCNPLLCDTRLKLQPLCYDTATGQMVSPALFTMRRPSPPTWIFYLNNNPLISSPAHPILRLALARATRILLTCPGRPDIQSTTGPGNLTASVLRHAISSRISGRRRDFMILHNWDKISISPWPLSYRHDDRNWRLLK